METKGDIFVRVLLPIAILSFLGWLSYFFISSLFSLIGNAQKDIATAIIAAAATIFISITTIFIGRYFERKKELDALHRDKKTQIYDEFLGKFFENFQSADHSQEAQDEMTAVLRDFMRKILLWSGPGVVESFVKWKDSLSTVNAESVFATEDFLLAVRTDLAHSNSGIRKGFFAKLFLAKGDLFLMLAKKNPKISLAEVARIEAELEAAASSEDLPNRAS